MDNKVYIIKCGNYDDVADKLPKLIEMMGGIGQYAAPGEKIALKVNLLRAAKPDEAVTTHPSIVSAISEILAKINAESIIIDSPGSGYKYNEKMLLKTYRETGMQAAAQESGGKLNFDCSFREVSYPEGKLIKRFEIISPIIDSDGVFNLCKMKTHLFTRMTGAVKNNFGVIPGLTKPGYHGKLHDTLHFADMLLDLAQYVSPRLNIMDAVVGMEGDGPNSGTPRKVGFLIASVNQLALDVVASEIMGLSRRNNPILLAAERRELGPTYIQDVEIIGEKLSQIKITDYKFPANISEGTGIGPLSFVHDILNFLFKNAFSARPVINKNACIGCKACYEACPVGAITMEEQEKTAVIDGKKCIRCYCCHEMCPEDAIELKYSLLHKMMNN
jgi:uncharacterized protein (DUF362 family)/ferredoxin